MKSKQKDEILRKIDFWSKHQELDKFNYNFISSYLLAIIASLIGLFNSPIIYFLSQKELISILGCSVHPHIIALILTIVFLVLIFAVLYYMPKKQQDFNRSFRVREAMLRVWHNELSQKKKAKSMTDELDEQFEEIKKQYNGKMTNKEIENIAEGIMENQKFKK